MCTGAGEDDIAGVRVCEKRCVEKRKKKKKRKMERKK
jgi:hypothetical protein